MNDVHTPRSGNGSRLPISAQGQLALVWSGHWPMPSGIMPELIPNGTIQTGWPYSQKLSAVNGCDLSVVQQCEAHGQATCKVYKGCSSFDCSGLPCPDFSTAGLKRKRQGPTVPVYMAHGKYVCKSRVPLLLIECTKDHWHSYLTYFVFSTNRFG